MSREITACIIIIGNEILSGRTQDKNIAFISSWLNSECGIYNLLSVMIQRDNN